MNSWFIFGLKIKLTKIRVCSSIHGVLYTVFVAYPWDKFTVNLLTFKPVPSKNCICTPVK